MDQSNNLVAGFNHLWQASTLPTLVTGGLQWSAEHMKAGQIPRRPYAQVWVDHDGRPEWTAGLSYLQRYGITVKVWLGSDNTVMRAVDSLLDALLPFSTKFESAAAGGFLTENAQTVHVMLSAMAEGARVASAGPGQEAERANQQNIGTINKFWQVALNETRSAV